MNYLSKGVFVNIDNCKKIDLYIEYKGASAERLGKALFGGKTLYNALSDAAEAQDVDVEDYILQVLIDNLSTPFIDGRKLPF